VVAVAMDNATVDAVKLGASRYGSEVSSRVGKAEFIGAESRPAAQKVYEGIIAGSGVQNREAVWSGLRDRWSAVTKALIEKYSPDQPRDDHGRWVYAGGPGSMGDSDINADGIHAENIPTAKTVKKAWFEQSAEDIEDAEKARQLAAINKEELDRVGKLVAEETGAEYRATGIKSLDGIQRKMDAGRAAGAVTDAVRASIAVSSPEQADSVVAALGRYFPATDEGFRVTEVGYFDRTVNMRFSNGQVGELQIAPPQLFAAKSNKTSTGGGHDLYVKWRGLPASSPERVTIGRQMNDLYAGAYKSLSPDWHRAVPFNFS